MNAYNLQAIHEVHIGSTLMYWHLLVYNMSKFFHKINTTILIAVLTSNNIASLKSSVLLLPLTTIYIKNVLP